MNTYASRTNNATTCSNSLMAKVMMLLSGSLVISSIGTYMGLGITSGWVLFGLVRRAHSRHIWCRGPMAAASPALGVAGLAIWTFLNGLAIGPAVNMYAAVIGWQTVTFSFMGTAAIMAALGCWGAFSGRDFSAWGKWLFIGLLGLIIVGVIGLFTGFGHSFNLLYSLAGMVIFAGYFVFDFFRLSRSEDNDFNAVMITMNIYLDFVNFWLVVNALHRRDQRISSS
jgi:FtsH-binding integral membrane protein